MITVPQATEKIIRRSRYLTEAIAKDLINASSLARYIHPEVEQLTMKTVTRGSIVMAIKRFTTSQKPKAHSLALFTEAPDMIVRSNQSLFFVRHSPSLLKKLSTIESASSNVQKKALFNYGRGESMILANKLATHSVIDVLRDESITLTYTEVSSITLHMPAHSVQTPGMLNFFIKSLAWEGINLLGMVTTQSEITLIFSASDIHTAFGVLQSLFKAE